MSEITEAQVNELTLLSRGRRRCSCEECMTIRSKESSHPDKTAARLLLQNLNEEQREYVLANSRLYIQGKFDGYTINLDGSVHGDQRAYCIAVAASWTMPFLEKVLTLKLWIETNEALFRRVANTYSTTSMYTVGNGYYNQPLAYLAPDQRV